MRFRPFSVFLVILFIVQFTYSTFFALTLEWNLYFIPSWHYYKYPKKILKIRELAYEQGDRTLYVRKNLNYFDTYFFDYLVSQTDETNLLKSLTDRFFFLSEISGTAKLVEFSCDAMKFYELRYDGCSIEREVLLD